MHNKCTSILLLIALCYSLCLAAREPYRATVFVSGETASVDATNLVNLSRNLRSDAIESLIPIYTPTSPTAININLRGINVVTAFAAGSTTLNVFIPQAGITQSFDGGSRDNSVALFKEFIRDGGNSGRLLRGYARYSPIDPIAGNPNSLLAQMAQAEYLVGHLSPLAGCGCDWCAQPIVHQFQAGMRGGRAFSRGFDTTTFYLPLRYSYSPDLKAAFILDAPLTFNDNGGAYSIFSSLGVAFRYPITCNWSFTPTIRFGAGGSLDLCTAGSFISTGLTSVYNYPFKDTVISLTNYAGYYTSTNLWLGGVNFNYRLHTCIFKNGLSVTSCKPYTIGNYPLHFSASFVDSYFARERLYIKHYDEVEFSLITSGINPCIDYDCLIVGFAYQFGQKNYKGYFFNFTYQF